MVAGSAQPKLRKDNIDEILSAMTLEEKASLLVGGAQAIIVNGIPTGIVSEVPGAAAQTTYGFCPLRYSSLGLPLSKFTEKELCGYSALVISRLWLRRSYLRSTLKINEFILYCSHLFVTLHPVFVCKV